MSSHCPAARGYNGLHLQSLSKLAFISIGNLFDDTSALQWILSQADDDSIEELTSTMIEKLVKNAKHAVVLFCKYAGYVLIAFTHTCYMVRHYSGSNPPTASTVVTTHDHREHLYDRMTGEPLPNGDVIVTTAEQKPSTYLPPDRVKGLAMES